MIFREDSNVRSRLTVQMREALQEAKRGPLRRVHDLREGRPQWPAPASTLAALVRHELVAYDKRRNNKGHWTDEWSITDAGREALKPAPPKPVGDKVRFLAPTGRGADYTSDRHRAVDELEAVPALVLDDFASANWARHAERAVQPPECVVERLERALASARAAGTDTARYEARIRQAVEVLEKRTRRDAA